MWRDTWPSTVDVSWRVSRPHQRNAALSTLTADQNSHALLQEATETWMLLEFADRGSLDKAIAARRFYRRGSVTLDLVRPVPVSASVGISSCRRLQDNLT